MFAAPSDRIITCPDCFSDNELIGSDLVADMIIHCSNCGYAIGPCSDTRDRYVSHPPAEPAILEEA